jgi:hypothetical protein
MEYKALVNNVNRCVIVGEGAGDREMAENGPKKRK